MSRGNIVAWITHALILLIILLVVFTCAGHARLASITAGVNNAFALNDDGAVWGWGRNYYGQIGNGAFSEKCGPSSALIDNVTMITTNGGASYALKNDGTVWAWGYGESGWLGDGRFENRCVPVQVKTLTNVKAIAAGSQNCYALKNDGTVWAWGDNRDGQCGDGTTMGDGTTGVSQYGRATPVRYKGLEGVESFITGCDQGVVAVKNDGTMWALETNKRVDKITYGTVTDPSTYGFIKICGQKLTGMNADGHYVALKSDGTVWTWGAYVGRRGSFDKSGLDKEVEESPTRVEGLDHVVDVAAAHLTDYALKDDGTVWGWGRNDVGELGSNYRTVEPYPVLVFKGPTPTSTPTPMPTSTPTPTQAITQLSATPASTPTPTIAQQSATPPSTPTPAPGFELATTLLAGLAITTLITTLRKKSR
jgi:alpha-tubulin suppressor-like RCC1 family protein